MRLTTLLLAFVCVFGLFPEAAFAASDTITLKAFGHSDVGYNSPALGHCTRLASAAPKAVGWEVPSKTRPGGGKLPSPTVPLRL